jgi:transcriptional regulator with XRE-family HTH domain
MKTLAVNLREHRESLGLTREDLAETSGVSVATISSIERCKAPSAMVTTVAKLAEAMNINVCSLFN